jgi:hypothetical protein
MRLRWMTGAVCLTMLGASGWAQSNEKPWLGVWQSMLDGQPGAIVTLADDGGQPGGTVVLNIIRNESGVTRVVGSQPMLLMHSRLEAQTLTFEVKSPRAPNGTMNFTMTLKTDGTATIHCTNCNGAPVVELTKEW